MPPRQPASKHLDEDPALPLRQPKHIEDFLLFRIFNLSKLSVRGVNLMFSREVGISRRDWRILAYLGRRPNMSLTELAEVTDLDQVIVSRHVANLVQRGLVVKTRRPSNKRLIVLALSDAGRGVYDQALRCGRRYNIEFASCFSDEEAKWLQLLLTKLEHRAHELTEREVARGGRP